MKKIYATYLFLCLISAFGESASWESHKSEAIEREKHFWNEFTDVFELNNNKLTYNVGNIFPVFRKKYLNADINFLQLDKLTNFKSTEEINLKITDETIYLVFVIEHNFVTYKIKHRIEIQFILNENACVRDIDYYESWI